MNMDNDEKTKVGTAALEDAQRMLHAAAREQALRIARRARAVFARADQKRVRQLMLNTMTLEPEEATIEDRCTALALSIRGYAEMIGVDRVEFFQTLAELSTLAEVKVVRVPRPSDTPTEPAS